MKSLSIFARFVAIASLVCGVSADGECSLNTSPTVAAEGEGPFYIANAPLRDRLAPEDKLADLSNVLVLQGQIFGNDCAPLSNAMVEVWYAGVPDALGNYYSPAGSEMENRGRLVTDSCGQYKFTQLFPLQFLGSPHVHFRVSLDGGEADQALTPALVVTEMYLEESLAQGFHPAESQVVRVTNEADGSRSTVFNIHVDVPGTGSIESCGKSGESA